MTENEAIKLHIKENLKRIITIKEFLKTNSDANDKECNENILILTSANVALKEIQQYRAIGTVEECRDAMKRNYNDGWILCSDRLPEEERLQNYSIEDCTSYLVQRRNGIMDVAHYISVYGEPYFEANALEIRDVIAWQPLAEPYKPQ